MKSTWLPRSSKTVKNKKILYAASTVSHINNFHLDYIKALRDEGFEVLVMARGEGADFDIPFEKKLFSSKNTACRREIRKIIREGDFGAIILNTSLAAFHIRLACPRKNRPRIVNIVHGYLFSRDVNPLKSALLILCEKLMRRRTDAIITMNEADFEAAQKYRLTRGKIYRSRGMGAVVRPEMTAPDNIRREYFPSGAFVMTFVGELSGRKNQAFLINALRELKPRMPEAVLCLVGEGDAREELMALARGYGLSESVVFTGARSDACDFIRASDLYVSASCIEGMPFNLIEALGAGRTVLASRVKGHEDLVEDGVDGYLYEYGNTEEFVNKICQIKSGGALSADKIREKYLMYEKSAVLPETLGTVKEALLCD